MAAERLARFLQRQSWASKEWTWSPSVRRDAAKAERFRLAYGGKYSCDDAERVIGDPSIDAIYITTWHDSHADLAIRAACAGKHVMIEKPLALSVAECQAIGRAVDETGIKLMVAFKMRYYELVAKRGS